MALWYDSPTCAVFHGDVLAELRGIGDGVVNCCVTSPPYFGLRDYGTGQWEGGNTDCDHKVRENARIESSTLGGGKNTTGHQREGFKSYCPRCGARRIDSQLGLEKTPDECVTKLVEVFRAVRRVLRDDGTLWIVIGDSYAAGGGAQVVQTKNASHGLDGMHQATPGFAAKQMLGIPWRLAFALQADGWWLRSDIIWNKPNTMPSSVRDRCTTSHEYVFMLTKSARYYFDAKAIAEPSANAGKVVSLGKRSFAKRQADGAGVAPSGNGNADEYTVKDTRNKRDVWTVLTSRFPEAHFATFPPKLIEPCILAGCPPGGLVLDPFAGSGTTLMVANFLGRRAVGIELQANYLPMIQRRVESVSSKEVVEST